MTPIGQMATVAVAKHRSRRDRRPGLPQRRVLLHGERRTPRSRIRGHQRREERRRVHAVERGVDDAGVPGGVEAASHPERDLQTGRHGQYGDRPHARLGPDLGRKEPSATAAGRATRLRSNESLFRKAAASAAAFFGSSEVSPAVTTILSFETFAFPKAPGLAFPYSGTQADLGGGPWVQTRNSHGSMTERGRSLFNRIERRSVQENPCVPALLFSD